MYLLGKNGRQVDGTILSIDFQDAFRSVSLRWFNLVMNRLRVPKVFVDWFWMMYSDLSIHIVINRCKSEGIINGRGFLEGHPPSKGTKIGSRFKTCF